MKTIYLITFISLTVGFSTLAQPPRYIESIFTETDTFKNIEYALADWLNNPIPLLNSFNIHEGEKSIIKKPLNMDIFLPHGDTLKKRPAIIFAHSGGFLIGSRLADDMVAFCDSFARRGYVTATIDYRIGMGAEVARFFGIIIGLNLPESTGYRALYRATQDGRAAVRFLKHNAVTYGIDTTKIFMVGSSAGALLTLYNQYLDTEAEIPADALAEPSLGGLDTVGVQGYGAQANAYVSMWGSVEKTEMIENVNTPGLLIHGMDDDIVHFKKGKPMDGMIGGGFAIDFSMPETYGSYCIDTALTNRGIPHETYFVEGQKHEFYGVDTGEFPEEGPNAYWDTVQWRITDFFYDKIKPQAEFTYQQEGLTFTFENTSSDFVSSEWTIEEQAYYDNQLSHTFTREGNFDVTLKTCNQNLTCDTITKTVSAGTAVSSILNSLSQVKIYPNPVHTDLFISGIQHTSVLKIYDLSGRLRYEKKVQPNAHLNVSNLEPGLYFFKLKNVNGIIIKKLVKK